MNTKITKRKELEAGDYIEVTFGMNQIKDQDPYFSITGQTRHSCGCLHEEIAKYFPEYASLIKWHLFSPVTGPMHYKANALYLLGQGNVPGFNSGRSRWIRSSIWSR